MATELVPIKVKLGLKYTSKGERRCKYPDWSKVPMKANDPSYKVHKIGWRYDKCGHNKEREDSPTGMQWGFSLVEEEFAKQAVQVFPDEVFILTPEEAEDMWDNKIHCEQSEEKRDVNTLQALQAELTLRKELGDDVTEIKAKIRKALDPDDDEPGVKKNVDRHLKDAIKDVNIKLKDVTKKA